MITYNYSINEADYLTHQLYTASESKQIKTKRMRSKLLFPLICCIFATWLLFKDCHTLLAIIFFIMAVLWYLFYPIWESHYYKKHYQAFVAENCQNKCNITLELSFDNHCICLKGPVSEGKIQTSAIKEINEISTIIFIKFKTGIAIILPKDKIKDAKIDTVIAQLQELAAHLKINYKQELDWRWK